MWASIASAVLGKASADSEAERNKKEAERMQGVNTMSQQRQTLMNNQIMAGQDKVMARDAYQRQQSVLDEIMQKYKIGGM